jgi:hypothetical protein
MGNKRLLPQNPLSFIQQCVRERRIFWTYHVNMRLRDRFISREAILTSVESFEIIESYHDDKYMPNYLIWAQSQGEIAHVLFAADIENRNVRVVTAYRPSPAEWPHDFKVRKPK